MKKRHLWLILCLVLAMAVSGCIDDGDDDDDNDDGASGGSGSGGGGGASSHTLNVNNNSNHTVWYVYVSPSTDETWGSDHLGSSALSPGETYEITVNDCDSNYDLRAEDDSTLYWERWDLYLSCGSTTEWNLNN